VPIIVKTIGSAGGRDYSSLAAWAASLPANLVADGNSYRGECYNDSEFTGASNLLTLSGHTTDASHTITLTTGAGQGFRDNANVQTNALRYNPANGVGISCSGSYATAIKVDDNNVFLSKLQVRTTGNLGGVALDCTGYPVTVQFCILENRGAGYTAMLEGGGTISNSLIVSTDASASSRAGLWIGGVSNVYFCTICCTSDAAHNAGAAFQIWYGTHTIENTAAFGWGAFNIGLGGTTTHTTCVTDLASPPAGWTGGKTYANQFQNTTTASGDFRAKTGADLQGAGTADVTNGATDIVGTARPQSAKWDIGCWELLASSAVVTVEAWVPIEHLPMQRGDWASRVEFAGSRRVGVSLPLDAITRQRADRYTALEGLVLQGRPLGLPVEVSGGVGTNTAGCVESLAQTFVSWGLTSELLRLLLREVTAGGEFATAVSCDAPAPAAWLRAIGAMLSADSIPPIEWSALPRPMHVSLERLLASPGKRRLLGTPGHMRLLTRL